MKTTPYLYIALLLLLAACSEEQEPWKLSAAQAELMGRAVNFSASHADPFATRTTYNHNGAFNQDDLMTIYRQYSEDNGQTFELTSAYRVYYYDYHTAAGSGYVLDKDWKVKVGETGFDDSRTPDTFTQTEADSLTWENGKTVRFRAWSRSNLDDAIPASRTNKGRYYPDFCVSEWVTVSGPTMDVPLVLKHQGCRIGFTTKAGNELVRAEICTEPEDYYRKDNSVMRADDESADEHGKTYAQAKAEADAVKAIYDKMCMPAGIDTEKALLSTMTKTLYENAGTGVYKDLSRIHEQTGENIITFEEKSADDIAKYVQRPLFCSNNGRLYMVTIPYDMSNNTASGGEPLILPPFTRFKIWLYDVNNGDKANTGSEEATYHIFSLADVMDSQSGGQKLFPDGMELVAGASYLFSVGYYYDKFDITPADNFSWDKQDAENGTGTNQNNTISETTSYKWWTGAIAKAIPSGEVVNYTPKFEINTVEEFLEFIKLVNGTAVVDYVKNNPLTRIPDPTRTFDDEHKPGKSDYRWYPAADVVDGKLRPSINPEDSIDRSTEEFKALGYIFYEHYHPATGDQAAYSAEDYLKEPYSFYDEFLGRHFTVWLGSDLDFQDKQLTTIGNTSATPFRGVFDGYDETEGKVHTIKNINMDGGYLFGYCGFVAIRNLQIETTHNFMLMNQATALSSSGYGAYIVGVSIHAPSSGSPIAGKLTGSSYVVGCFYEGTAGGAMVGEADNLNMYGNMMAASGLTSGTGALLGAYSSGASHFFAPQNQQKLTWGRFMCNYYDVTLSPGTNAVSSFADAYRPQEYIRGRESWILKAKNDNMISGDVPFDDIPTEQMKKGYYGWAPWKAMNYALYQYNLVGVGLSAEGGEAHNCKSHFVNGDTGYSHTYPQRVAGELDASGYGDILVLFN